MKASFGKAARNARNLTGEKESVGHRYVVAEHNGELRDIVTLRYWATKTRSKFYASLWVHSELVCTSGHAWGKNFGDHMYSKLLGGLADSANITIDDGTQYGPDWGRGETQVDAFLGAIATALGYTNYIIVRG